MPIVPIYTDGCYFKLKKRAHVIIGKPIMPADFNDPELEERENINRLNDAMRDRVIELEKLLNEQKQQA